MKGSKNYKSPSFYDDFYHVIKYHRNQFRSSAQKCTDASCPSIAYNYKAFGSQSQINESNLDNKDQDEICQQQAFKHMIHHQHEQLYHMHRSTEDRHVIMKRYPNYRSKLERFGNAFDPDENDIIIYDGLNDVGTNNNGIMINNDNDGLEPFLTGDILMDYEHPKSSRYVWCKKANLKEEWLDYNVTIANWNTAVSIARIKSKSKCIRKEYISKDEDAQKMSVVRIMVLYQYTANDEFQQELCKISRQSFREFRRAYRQRRNARRDPFRAYVNGMGKFGHTFKLLAETVERYGRDMADDNEYDIVYRGISILPKFKSATIPCFTPTSTTKTWAVAAIFGEAGCILEFHPDHRMTGFGLNMEPFSHYPHEYEVLFFGRKSYLRVAKLYNGMVKSSWYSFHVFGWITDMVTSKETKNKGGIRERRCRHNNNSGNVKKRSKSSGSIANPRFMNRKRNCSREAKILLQKYIEWKGWDLYREDMIQEDESSMSSGQSKENLHPIKFSRDKPQRRNLDLQQQPQSKPKLEYNEEKYDEHQDRYHGGLTIGPKGCRQNQEIQMRQLQYLLSSITKKNQKILYIQSASLVKCINDAFGRVDFRNIVRLFNGIERIEFYCAVDQEFIVEYTSTDFENDQDDKLYCIKIYQPLKDEYKQKARNELVGFDNNKREWEVFEKKDSVEWRRSPITITR